MAKVPLPAGADVPPGLWGRVLSFTPVVMTVVATLLAGLSNSELTRSLGDRTLAAQMQSKAGDQWSFFQAKKLRALETRSTADILRGTADAETFKPAEAAATIKELVGQMAHAGPQASPTQPAIPDLALPPAVAEALGGQTVADAAPWQPHDPAVQKAAAALAGGAPESTLPPLIAKVQTPALADEINSAAEYSNQMDARSGPVGHVIDRMESLLVNLLGAGRASGDAAVLAKALRLYNGFTIARLGYVSQRYDTEARHNQATATLYEIQVRIDNASANRHSERSKQFFYGMLGAQAAVIVASMALAVKQRDLLWSLAAAVGVAAVSFATYVYLWV